MKEGLREMTKATSTLAWSNSYDKFRLTFLLKIDREVSDTALTGQQCQLHWVNCVSVCVCGRGLEREREHTSSERSSLTSRSIWSDPQSVVFLTLPKGTNEIERWKKVNWSKIRNTHPHTRAHTHNNNTIVKCKIHSEGSRCWFKPMCSCVYPKQIMIMISHQWFHALTNSNQLSVTSNNNDRERLYFTYYQRKHFPKIRIIIYFWIN